MIRENLDRAFGTMMVETLLAVRPQRFFTAVGELDWYRRAHRGWMDNLGLDSGARVLEVGCGTGALSAYIAESARVTGIDRSSAMISRARATYPDLDFRVGDATELAEDDHTFDAVVAASVVNIVEDPQAVVSEMRRVCVPGGLVAILVPSSEFTDGDCDTLIESLDVSGFSRAVLTKWHRTAPKMSRSMLETVVRGADLEPTSPRKHLGGMLIAVTG